MQVLTDQTPDLKQAHYGHKKCGSIRRMGAVLAERYISEGIGNASRSVYCETCAASFHPSEFEWVIHNREGVVEVSACKD